MEWVKRGVLALRSLSALHVVCAPLLRIYSATEGRQHAGALGVGDPPQHAFATISVNAFREIRIGACPIVIAHRGDSFHAPENTLEAAILGQQSGAFAWELDVHLSRDGVPVVIHDDSLTRTTNVSERFEGDSRARDGFRVADFSWEEIHELDAGSWFVNPAGGARTAVDFGTYEELSEAGRRRFASGQIRIPSLIEALRLTKELNWMVNVELKTFPEADRGLLAAVFDDIRRIEMADRVLISSFDHDEVALAVKLRPEVACGALCHTPLRRSSAYVRDLVGADFFHTSAEALGSVSRNYRQYPSAASLRAIDLEEPRIPTFVYTVNDARPHGLAAHLEARGAAGIFSDNPGALVKIW